MAVTDKYSGFTAGMTISPYQQGQADAASTAAATAAAEQAAAQKAYEDWLASGGNNSFYGGGSAASYDPSTDPMYIAQANALDTALENYKNEIEAQRQTYNANYGESLRKLGFSGDHKMLDKATFDPATGTWSGAGDNVGFNQTDQNTASGRAYVGNRNDFASRGMLQGTDFARASNNIDRSLNEQLSNTAKARNTSMADFDRQKAAKASETASNKGQLQQESIARLKSGYGIGQVTHGYN